MFLKTKVDIGRVKQGQEVIVEFPYEKISKIVTMESSCGCGNPYDDSNKSLLWVRYLPGMIDHLPDQSIKTEKTVTVTYIDDKMLGQTEVLTFTANVFKRL